MHNNQMRTQNGMPTLQSSLNANLDLFFKMGASRNLDDLELTELFSNALEENEELAIRNMFYNRDIRDGQGERRSFRIMWKWLSCHRPAVARAVMDLVPYYGRWDDLLHTSGVLREEALNYIRKSILNGDRLAAKWMPREHKANHAQAVELMNTWGMTPRQYRQFLAGNTKVVESLMCAQKWDQINYEHVPSRAANKYRAAFMRHDPEGYSDYLARVKSGEAKIHAGAIFPHDIVRNYIYPSGVSLYILDEEENPTTEAQWQALPDYMPKGMKILTIADTSGSMSWNGGIPILVAASLAVYTAERNEGPFKNKFLTFSQYPDFIVFGDDDSLLEKLIKFTNAPVGGNTDLEAAFRLILNTAKYYNVPPEEMPNVLLILSDMQFDEARGYSHMTSFDMIDAMYRQAGYERPNIYYWNLDSKGGVPVTFDQNGTALISGFSPSILKSVLSGEINPLDIMLNTLMTERYDRIFN